MRVETLSTYILELPSGEELRLNESAWNAVQHLLKEAKREALLEAIEMSKRYEWDSCYVRELEKMAKELE